MSLSIALLGCCVTAAVLRGPCRSFARDDRLCRCGAEWRFECFETGYATKSAFRLREEVNNRELKDAAVDRGASYRDCELFVILSCCVLGIRTVHL